MRKLSDYNLDDWRRLRPLTHRLKTWRYQWVNQVYLKQKSPTENQKALQQAIAGRDVLVTIAFNDPEAIDWQARLLRHYVPGAQQLIADNSSEPDAAAGIAAVAARHRIPYLRLPVNPWRAVSRSHGIAMNWVWHNVLRPGAPRAFGFIDDDLFPTAPDDPFAPLATQDFYGLVREFGPRWFLWAGYCVFLFDAVKHKPLDFGQDWFLGLDTGGANWDVLYAHVERSTLQHAPSTFIPYKPGIAVSDGPMQWCGTWLHEVGVMGDLSLSADKRRVLSEILAPHLASAGEATGQASMAMPPAHIGS